MTIELDHCFIFTAAGAPEGDRLVAAGLAEGSPNRHPGQGTANRRFFFENAFLELVFVTDADEVRSQLVRRTGLAERGTRFRADASPFGVGFRPAPGAEPAAPFPTWEYRPPYLPAPLAIHMGDNSERVTEPLLFYLPFGRRPEPSDPARQQPRVHRIGMRAISRLTVSIPPNAEPSLELQVAARACNGLTFVPASEHCMEIGFDGERAGQTLDLRPVLPLVLYW